MNASYVNGFGYQLPGAGEGISTLNFTIPAGVNKVVVVGANIRFNPPRTITGITWNAGAEAFTGPTVVEANAETPPSFTRIEEWHLDSPTATTADIVVTWDGAARGQFFVVLFSDAKPGAIAVYAVQATSAALAITVPNGGVGVSAYAIDDGDGTTIALTAGPTSRYNAIGSAGAGGTSSRMGVATKNGTGVSESFTWTPTGTGAQPAHIVFAVEATAASTALEEDSGASLPVRSDSD